MITYDDWQLLKTVKWDDAGRMMNTNIPNGATAGVPGFSEYDYVVGLRVWKKITRSGSVVEHRVHIHAGPNLIAEYNAGVAASTPVQEYVYGGEIDSLALIRRNDATKYGVTRNRQWSITALHDLANGNIVERYAYEMTGKRTIYAANGTTVRTTSSYGNPFGYTNRWHDEDSGLMYFRARHYNPLSGEFLSRDPLEFVDGMSLYRGYFVITGTDPIGQCRSASDNLKYQKVKNLINCPDGRLVFTNVPDANGGPPPLYRDPSLNRWYAGPNNPGAKHILSLNHMCFRVDWQCDNDGKGVFNGIDFELFMTIPTDMPIAEFLEGIYGHELHHLVKMQSCIQEALKQLNADFWCNFGNQCVDCEEFGQRLEVFKETLWTALGPCFRHGIPGSVGWGVPLDPKWGGKDIDVPADKDIPPRPYCPRHGADGWFCSMDQVMAEKRSWPDWEFPSPGRPNEPQPRPVR